jgi:hypothetical protein
MPAPTAEPKAELLRYVLGGLGIPAVRRCLEEAMPPCPRCGEPAVRFTRCRRDGHVFRCRCGRSFKGRWRPGYRPPVRLPVAAAIALCERILSGASVNRAAKAIGLPHQKADRIIGRLLAELQLFLGNSIDSPLA